MSTDSPIDIEGARKKYEEELQKLADVEKERTEQLQRLDNQKNAVVEECKNRAYKEVEQKIAAEIETAKQSIATIVTDEARTQLGMLAKSAIDEIVAGKMPEVHDAITAVKETAVQEAKVAIETTKNDAMHEIDGLVQQAQKATEAAEQVKNEVEGIAKKTAEQTARVTADDVVKRYHDQEFVPHGKDILQKSSQEVSHAQQAKKEAAELVDKVKTVLSDDTKAVKEAADVAETEAEICGQFKTWSQIAAIIAVVCLLGSGGLAFWAYQSLNSASEMKKSVESHVRKAEEAKTAAETAAANAKNESDKAQVSSGLTEREKKAIRDMIKEINELQNRLRTNLNQNNANSEGE